MPQLPLFHVVAVEPLEGFKLRLTFENGVAGIVNVAQQVRFTGVFEPLQDLTYFRQVRVNFESGTICWESGADFDPVVLYCLATGQPIPGEEA